MAEKINLEVVTPKGAIVSEEVDIVQSCALFEYHKSGHSPL
jgi:F0F1-type ATP synthase epsilon subunit